MTIQSDYSDAAAGRAPDDARFVRVTMRDGVGSARSSTGPGPAAPRCRL